MKLHIDWTLCDGRGLCVELLPELLEEDDWAYPVVRSGRGNEVEVADDIAGHARRAVAQCPLAALRLTR